MQLYVMGATFTIKLKQTEYIAYSGDEYPSCIVEIYTNDMCSKFEFNGLYLCKFHLDRIIEYIDKTLNNEFEKKVHLQFEDPHILGGPCYSPLSFEIHGHKRHELDYWKFIYNGAGGWHNSGKNVFSMCLNREDIEGLKAMLLEEMDKINWDSCGKTDYYKIEFPDIPYIESYSASKLKNEILSLCNGLRLENVMIETESLTELYNSRENHCYFSIGSTVLLYFHNFIIDFKIYASGLFHYRVIPKEKIICIEKVFDKLPSYDSPCYSEIEALFTKTFIGENIKGCEATATKYAPFGNLDESLCGELPEKLIFELSNGNKLILSGDEIEYFAITVK